VVVDLVPQSFLSAIWSSPWNWSRSTE
jgi:hypothetical protein